jgi:hypothetical protein
MRDLNNFILKVNNFYNQVLSSDTAKKIVCRDKPYSAIVKHALH